MDEPVLLWPIIKYTHRFINSISDFDIKNACKWMNNETDLRCAMTPEVFDELGNNLFESAKEEGCGARFTGAGGGGCIWALGEKEKIAILKIKWENILSSRNSACLLKSPIDSYGLLYN
jgi:D-glycero-alpha-D-manno-heptose-7-phosphate kinase